MPRKSGSGATGRRQGSTPTGERKSAGADVKVPNEEQELEYAEERRERTVLERRVRLLKLGMHRLDALVPLIRAGKVCSEHPELWMQILELLGEKEDGLNVENDAAKDKDGAVTNAPWPVDEIMQWAIDACDRVEGKPQNERDDFTVEQAEEEEGSRVEADFNGTAERVEENARGEERDSDGEERDSDGEDNDHDDGKEESTIEKEEGLKGNQSDEFRDAKEGLDRSDHPTSLGTRQEDAHETPRSAKQEELLINSHEHGTRRAARNRNKVEVDASHEKVVEGSNAEPDKTSEPPRSSRGRKRKIEVFDGSDDEILTPHTVKRLMMSGSASANNLAPTPSPLPLVSPTDAGTSDRKTTMRGKRESSLLESIPSSVREQSDSIVECYRVLKTLAAHKLAIPFREPVSERDAPDYYSVIKSPMDLRTLRTMLESGKIESPLEFQKSLVQICKNAIQYNARGSDLDELAKEFRALIREHTDPLVAQWKKLSTKKETVVSREATSTGASHEKAASEKDEPAVVVSAGRGRPRKHRPPVNEEEQVAVAEAQSSPNRTVRRQTQLDERDEDDEQPQMPLEDPVSKGKRDTPLRRLMGSSKESEPKGAKSTNSASRKGSQGTKLAASSPSEKISRPARDKGPSLKKKK
ncbi:Bromodomain-containing protein 8 [Porphyridium purpureum]|uniref:Bromodomain-containing protein 8 n=1 Tax=Porphyridium purpureum TaxID=35688 RepID=A0A5J4Z3K3_PORPP|nr:Bromodomain-containing protein 8 [Porphyridium purpureum]|eukprot:POR3392..scf208_2